MVKGFLSDEVKISILSHVTAGAAATSAITSSALDMQGFDAAMFYVPIGTIVTNGVQSVKLQQSSDDGAADDYSDIVGTNMTIADDDDNEAVVIDIQRPQKRYLKLVISRATQNSTFGGIHAIQYKRGVNPQTGPSHGTGVTLEQHAAPAEGTA